MEICVIKHSCNCKTYGRGFSEGFFFVLRELLYSGTCFNQNDLDEFLDWLKDDRSDTIGWHYVDIDKAEDGFLYISTTYTDHDIFNPYLIRSDVLLKVLKDWVEFIKKNPREIVLIRDGDEIKVEGRYFEPSVFDTLELSSWRFTKETEEKLFSLKSKKVKVGNKEIELFEGGFHFMSQDEKPNDVEIVNERLLEKKIDFIFKDNFYVNHALFPKEWSKEKIKKSILAILQRGGTKRIEIADKILNIINAYDGLDIRILINEKGEILTAYPICESGQE